MTVRIWHPNNHAQCQAQANLTLMSSCCSSEVQHLIRSGGGLEKLNQPTRHHPYRSNVNGLLNVHVRFAYRDIRRIRFAFRDTTFAEPG